MLVPWSATWQHPPGRDGNRGRINRVYTIVFVCGREEMPLCKDLSAGRIRCVNRSPFGRFAVGGFSPFDPFAIGTTERRASCRAINSGNTATLRDPTTRSEERRVGK